MGELRIIAGRFRGRRLRLPSQTPSRPTADRVREALFSILGPTRLEGARVLDAYAGSGALGIEALSRGAASAVFIERDRRMCRSIEDALTTLGVADDGQVLEGDVRTLLTRRRLGTFDLILADPPYAGEEGLRFLQLVSNAGLLEPRGLLVLERATRSDPCPEGRVGVLERCREARYGDTTLSLLTVAPRLLDAPSDTDPG